MGEISNSQTWCIKPRHVLSKHDLLCFAQNGSYNINFITYRKYRCHIRVADKKKRFLINLKECKVHPKILKYEGKLYNNYHSRTVSITYYPSYTFSSLS